MEKKRYGLNLTDTTKPLEWSYYHTVWHFYFGDDYNTIITSHVNVLVR